MRVLKDASATDHFGRKFLATIINKFRVVSKELVPKTAIRLNSLVLLWHPFLNKIVRFRIVPPDQMDLSHRNISVFAPIGMAVFGREENDRVTVTIGGIKKSLRIIKVVNR